MSERLVELLDPLAGETVLELAAGLGDTGFLALERLRPGGRLLSTDGAPEMVAAARRRATEVGLEAGEELELRVEDASELTVADRSVDGVLCRWGLMLVPEPERTAREIARVLRPGGRAAVAVWGDHERNEWMTAAGRSALELGLLERPDPKAPGPFRLAADGLLEGVLAGAGLRVETAETVAITWRAGSLAEWWDVTRDVSRMLAQLLERVGTADEARIAAGARRRLERYVDEDGSVSVPGLARVALATTLPEEP